MSELTRLETRIYELEQAQIANQLQNGAEPFRLLVESVKDYAIFLLDTEGRVASWNLGAERIKGYKAHEIIGQHFSKFYPQSDLDWDKPGMELREATRVGRFEDEGWRIRKDGSRFWANVIITALFDEQGQLKGFAKVTRDMTERKQAEDAIKEANALLEQRVQERTIQLEAAIRLREEVLQREQTARRLAQQAEQVSLFLAEVSKVLVSSLNLAATLQNVGGLIVPRLANFWAVLLQDDSSLNELELAEFTANWNDLSQKSIGETEPLEIERRLRSELLHEWGRKVMKSGSPLTISFTNNPSAPSTLSENTSIWQKEFSTIIALPLIVRDSVTGALIFGVSAAPDNSSQLKSEGLSVATPQLDLVLGQELAGRIALAVDNARFYQQAQKAIGLRDEFLAIAAHELKTPITGLKGYSQMLVRQSGRISPEKLETSLRVINQQADKLNLLIQHLLDISRLQAGKMVLQPQMVEVVGLVKGVVDSAIVTLPLPTEHQIQFAADPAQFEACLDALRFEQVVTNLVSNAIKYSPQGGLIRVELKMFTFPVAAPDNLSEAEIDKLQEIIGLTSASTFMRLVVTDEGPGISEEHRGQLFERFYQAPNGNYSSGMGLGLYISREIIELHGGKIWAEFGKGGGSKFLVILPVSGAMPL